MAIKEWNASMGVIDPPDGQALITGYYMIDGQRYYYNALTNQWYLCSGLLLVPLTVAPQAVSWKPSPSPMISLMVGDTLRTRLSFYYKGPARTQNFYMALGANRTSGWFDEWGDHVLKNVPIPLPRCDTPTLINDKYIDMPIVGRQGAEAAAYCKLSGVDITTEGINTTPLYYDVCSIVAAEGEFSEFKITKFEKA
jgi:hypothetical protein